MAFEWDQAKARTNEAKHGVRFSDAISALEDDNALTEQDAFSLDEGRWITLGRDALARIVVVVYTWRGDTIRIISARLATKKERAQYAGV